jgi:hypothetical protein
MTPDQRLLATLGGYLLGAVLLLAGGAWVGYAWRDRGADRDLAECQRAHAEALAITLRAAQAAEGDYRAREAQIHDQHQEIIRAANTATTAARADADRVRTALDRLRRAAAVAPRGGDPAAHPATAAGSAPAGAAADLPPDLLWRLGQAAGELAAFADTSRTAGLACERDADSVRAALPRLGGAP